MNAILAKKIEQGQRFLKDGKRIPVTKLGVAGNVVVALKTKEKDKYSAVQLGFEKRAKARPQKSPTSRLLRRSGYEGRARLRGASNKSSYRFLREVRITDADAMPAIGDVIKASEIFKPGDVVNVTGISKGKGYAGGVKRHHFKGGPRTHGQSDRERAPGSIGSTTTPGRVYKGKRMAGRMGHEQVTVKNLKIVFVDDNYVLIKGLVPGGRNTLLTIKKVKDVDKKFVPLYQEVSKEPAFIKTSADVEALADKSTGKEKKVEVKANAK